MRTSKMMFVCVCVIALTQIGWGQQANKQGAAPGIPGYLDPTTGTFTTKVQPGEVAEASSVPVEAWYGDFYIHLDLEMTTPVPSDGNVTCSSTAFQGYLDRGGGYSENATAVAKHTGSTWTCQMSIPYLWYLQSGTKDWVEIHYSACINGVQTLGSTATVVQLRCSSWGPFAAQVGPPLPPNGSKPTYTFNVRL